MTRAFKYYLPIFFALFAALNWYALQRYDLPYPHPVGPAFDNAIRRNHTNAINAHKPRYVLIGDSTLTKGVNTQLLAQELDAPLYSIDLPGSASTLWYLIIKNNIMAADFAPKYLLIFFRDNMLTMPGYRVQGQYLAQIEEYAKANDRLLVERAFLDAMNPLEKFAEAYLPIYAARWQLREQIENSARYAPAHLWDCPPTCINHALADVFEDANINTQGLNAAISAADENLYQPQNLQFEQQLPLSFLPEIKRMAEEKEVQLVLVRMKTLQHTTKFPALDKYMTGLKNYAAQHNLIILDFAGDPRLTASDFMDILHLNAAGQETFTRILAKEIKNLP